MNGRLPPVVGLLAALAWPGAATAQERPIRLDSLEVTVGSRASTTLAAATRSIEVVTADAIARVPARTLAEVLAWSLGIDIQPRSPAQADLAMRGAGVEQVLVLVDGVRMSDVQTGHFDLDLALPLAEIERIEILRGPATAQYGSDAVGGVLNIVTRRDAAGIEAAVDGGSFGTAGIAVAGGIAGADAALRIGAEARRSDGHRAGTESEQLQARAALDLATGARTLRADLAFAGRDFGARAFYTAPAAPYDEYEETRTLTASVAWLAASDADFTIEPRISFRRHEDDFILIRSDPSVYRNVHTGTQLGAELVARDAAGPALQWAAGAEAFVDDLESTGLGDRDARRAAAFAEVAAGRADGASVNLGVRADWHSDFGAFLAPSAAVAFRPADALRLHAAAGRAFRAPTWTDRYYVDPANIGSEDLDPERAWEAELGAELSPAASASVRATAFLRKAADLIDWARPAGADASDPWRTQNIESATFRGVEVDARVVGPLGTAWRLAATALDFESEAGDGYLSKYALRPLTRTVQLSAARRFFDAVDVSARLYHGRRAGAEGPASTDDACVLGAARSHTRADARLGADWHDWRAVLDLTNLTDTTICDVTGLPAPGRAAYLGIEFRLGGSGGG